MVDKIYSGFSALKIAICVVCLLTYGTGVVLAGGSLTELFAFAIFTRFYIVLPGFTLGKMAKISENFDREYVTPQIVLGIAFMVLCYCLSSFTGISLIVKRLPLRLGLASLNPKGKQINDKIQLQFMFLLYCCGIFVFTFLVVAKHAHPAKVGQLLVSQDFMWTVGNAESIKASLPPVDIRFSGVTLKYHYLTELITAAASTVTGISCYNILAFYMQGFVFGFLVLALYELGDFYYGSKIKTNLFMVSFFSLTCLSLWKVLKNGASIFLNNLLQVLLSNLNSQAIAFAFFAVFTFLFVSIVRDNNKNVGHYIATFVSFLLLTFSKSPMAAILAIAIVCAGVVNLVTKQRNIKAIIFGIAIAVVFAIIYFNFLSQGTGKSVQISFVKTLQLGWFKNFLLLFKAKNAILYKVSIPFFMLLNVFCIAPFQTLVVLPRAVKDIPKVFRLSMDKLWIYASIVGGLMAFFITYHEAFSQVYFLYVAQFFLNLLAVEYFDFEKLQLKNVPYYGIMFLSCITTVFLYVNFCGSGLRQFLFHYNILEKYPYIYCVKSEDELAGEYLRNTMQQGELFITNRTHTGRGEGLSNVYTCYSGKPSYMEGFKYTVSNMGVSWDDDVKPRLENVGKVFGIYDQPLASAQEIIDICMPLGIRYAVYSSQFEGDTAVLNQFEIVFEKDTVIIYKLY